MCLTFPPLRKAWVFVLRHLPVVRILHPVRQESRRPPNIRVTAHKRLFAREVEPGHVYRAVPGELVGGIVAQVALPLADTADALGLPRPPPLRERLPEPARDAPTSRIRVGHVFGLARSRSEE